MPDEGVVFQTTVATPPVGFKVAYDDVGGFAYQRVKLDLGADGASASVTGTVPVSGTVDTELPAAVALADNMANPTAPQVGAHAMIWDAVGANWDRQLQPLTDGQLRASAVPVSSAQLPAALVGGRLDQNLGAWLGSTAPTVGQKAMASSVPVALASDQSVLPAVSEQRAATLVGTTISAANTTVTLTLGAAGAGLFHYLTSIEIVVTNPTVTAVAAAATNLAWTSTNLGGLAWNAGTLLAAGAEKLITRMDFGNPLKSAVANTASTIVAPACGAGTLCRIQVTYFTAI